MPFHSHYLKSLIFFRNELKNKEKKVPLHEKLRSNSSVEYINEKKQKFEPYIKCCVYKNPLSS